MAEITHQEIVSEMIGGWTALGDVITHDDQTHIVTVEWRTGDKDVMSASAFHALCLEAYNERFIPQPCKICAGTGMV